MPLIPITKYCEQEDGKGPSEIAYHGFETEKECFSHHFYQFIILAIIGIVFLFLVGFIVGDYLEKRYEKRHPNL